MDAGNPSTVGKGAEFNESQANRIGSTITLSSDGISSTYRAGKGTLKPVELRETSRILPEQSQTKIAIDLRLPYVEYSYSALRPALVISKFLEFFSTNTVRIS